MLSIPNQNNLYSLWHKIYVGVPNEMCDECGLGLRKAMWLLLMWGRLCAKRKQLLVIFGLEEAFGCCVQALCLIADREPADDTAEWTRDNLIVTHFLQCRLFLGPALSASLTCCLTTMPCTLFLVLFSFSFAPLFPSPCVQFLLCSYLFVAVRY